MTDTTTKSPLHFISKASLATFNKDAFKWMCIWSGLYCSATLFFYKFYFPSLVHFFSPPDAFVHFTTTQPNNDSNNNNDDTTLPTQPETQPASLSNTLLRRFTITNDIPLNLKRRGSVLETIQSTLYHRDVRWEHTVEAASKLCSLLHGVATVYLGLRALKMHNITPRDLQRGVTEKDTYKTGALPLHCQRLIDVNIGYVVFDILMVCLPKWKTMGVFVVHHGLVFVCGACINHYKVGADLWAYIYGYSDVPTVVLHASWFIRNIAENMRGLSSLFSVRAVKEQMRKEEEGREKIEWVMPSVERAESVFLMIFAGWFFYVRGYLFTRNVVPWIRNTLKQNELSGVQKMFLVGPVGGILGLGYYWCYLIAQKIGREVL